MMRTVPLLSVLLLPLLAGGCISTATSIVKAPFQVAGKAVDWSTTSQEEADRNYGRKMRHAEAREGKERRAFENRCRHDGDSDYCRRGYRGYVAGRD